jgi:hypothetical protein
VYEKPFKNLCPLKAIAMLKKNNINSQPAQLYISVAVKKQQRPGRKYGKQDFGS